MTAAANTTATPAQTTATTGNTQTLPRRVYASGTLRKIIFSIVFLLLLPFFVSLFPMLFSRITHGLTVGTPGLIVLAVGFTFIMGLLVIELVSSIRSRVVLGAKQVRIRLPQNRGITSLFSYKTTDVDYDDIESVEIRREVYGGALAPVIMKGARVCLKDGTNIKLGYVNEWNVDAAFPFTEIGERIAARANVPIVDVGDVRRSAFKKTFGLHASPDERDTLSAADIAAVNRRHNMVIVALVGILIALMSLGIFSDGRSDIGHARLFSSGSSSSGR
ncbi:MAG: hypothetical protein K0U74_16705 [Alphaproteobacteria bacterium]|nr:hypothetical protein [Alphaproteobacteria bacterium]